MGQPPLEMTWSPPTLPFLWAFRRVQLALVVVGSDAELALFVVGSDAELALVVVGSDAELAVFVVGWMLSLPFLW
jgi:hypothetical protein